MKIGNKTWQNAVIRQIHWRFFTTNVFYCTEEMVNSQISQTKNRVQQPASVA